MIISKSFIRHYHNSLKKEELRLLIIFVDKDMSRIHALVTQQNGETIKADRKYIDWWSEPAYVYFTQAIVELIRRKTEALGFDFSQSETDGDSIISNAEKLKNSLFESTEPVDYETPDGEYYIEITYDEFERAIQDKIRSSIPSSCGSFDLIVLSGEKRKTPLVRKMFTEAFPDVSQEYIVCFEPEQDCNRMEQTVSLSVKTSPESAVVDSTKSSITSNSIERIEASTSTSITTSSVFSSGVTIPAAGLGVQNNAFFTPQSARRSPYQTRTVSNLDFWDEGYFAAGVRPDGTVALERRITRPLGALFPIRNMQAIERRVASWNNIRKVVCPNNGIFALTNDNRFLNPDILPSNYFPYPSLGALQQRKEKYDIFGGTLNVAIVFLDGSVRVMGDNTCGQIHHSKRETTHNWENINYVVFGGRSHTVGLRDDGRVVALGSNDDGECDVFEWDDVIDIAATFNNTFGLKRDGTVLAVGSNRLELLGANQWRDMRSICAHNGSVIGVGKTGYVRTLGRNDYNRLNIKHWEKIKEIKMFDAYSLGLQEDGTLLSTDETVLKKMHDMGVI